MNTTKAIRIAMLAIVGGLTLNAFATDPTISDVVVRQRWPWNRLVDINYVLTSEVGQKVDVTVTGYNGATALDIPLSAFSGDLYNVEQGFRRIVFDPLKTAYTNQPITQFRVNVQAIATPLYMVVDLTKEAGTSNQVVYLTEADLASGAYGSVQTNPVSGIESIIWTGVTNNSVYTTDKLVLRRIHAGTFGMGSDTVSTTLTKDFYAGVFEVTQRQWELVTGERPSSFNNSTYYATRPVEALSYDCIRENPNDTDDPAVNWPSNSNVSSASFMGLLRARTGMQFDLPTEAQWEYSCRAGTSTCFNDGNTVANVSGANANTNAWLNALGRYKFNGGYLADGVTAPASDCAPTNGTAIVGSYQANAWGLYDMQGNVLEWCLDWYADQLAGGSDPSGAVSGSYRVYRGGDWSVKASACSVSFRNYNYPTASAFWGVGFGCRLFLPLSN